MIPTMMNCSHQGEGWCLKCVQELNAKLVNAESLIDKLPKTKDGVVWLPWENKPVFWLLDDGRILECVFEKHMYMPMFEIKHAWSVKCGEYGNVVSDCYSTRKIAEKVKQEGEK